MKNNWKLEKLGDICEFINGKGHEKLIDEDGDYIVVNSKFVSSNGKVFKKSKSQLLPLLKNDIVMVMSDVPNGKTIAKCFKIEENNKYTLNQRVCSLRTNKIDIDFLFKQLNRNQYFLEFDNGENQTNLRKNDVLNCPILIPPLEEQQTIVAKLDQAFAAIDQAKANIEKNIANAKELFQSKLNQIFSQNGDGWVEKKLGEVVQFTNGRNQKEVLNVNGEYPILGSAGSIMGYATNFLCEIGTVIIGRKGNISKPLFIDFKFWNVDTAFGLFPKNKIMLPKFNYYLCLNIDFASHNKGTTIPSLVKSDLIEIKVSYPISLEIQQKIVTQLDQLQEQTNLLVTKYQQKLANLEELKKSILEKAFKGEL